MKNHEKIIKYLREADQIDGACMNHRGYGTYADAADLIEQMQKLLNSWPMTKDGVYLPLDEAIIVWYMDGNVLVQGAAGIEVEVLFADPNNSEILFSPNDGVRSCFFSKKAALDSINPT